MLLSENYCHLVSVDYISDCMVDTASLLAVGSKNLSTFISAKERLNLEAATAGNWGGRNLRHWAEMSLTKVILLH